MDQKSSNPKGFNTKESIDGIEIISPWYKAAMVWSLIIFAVFWISFSVYWIKTADLVVFQLLGLVFLTAGVGLIWYIVCLFTNKTTTTIASESLTIKHHPIPFPTYKNTYLKRSDIEFDGYETALFIKRKIEKHMNIIPQAVKGEYIKYTP